MDRRAFLSGQIAAGGSRLSRSSQPLSLAGLEEYQGAWTSAEVSHLLRRTMFGAKKSDVESLTGSSLANAVAQLLSPQPTPPEPIRYVGDGEVWVNSAYNQGQDGAQFAFLQTWYFVRMIEQPVNITEKMTVFWHNHFATGYNSVKDSRYMYKQHKTIRQNALGNFRTLVKEITLDPAMLRYLNGNTNTRTGPNENYARELQELFTIGKGPEIAPGNYTNYTEDDIKAAARVLTGWSDDQNAIGSKYNEANHDKMNKQFSSAYGNRVILGRGGAQGGAQELDELLTMIFDQPATAKYIVSKIYRWFVSTDISQWVDENIITPLAETFRQNNYEIKPVLDRLLKSAHFFDPALRGGMIKNPLDLGIGMMRVIPTDAFHDYKDSSQNNVSEKVPFLPTVTNMLHWSLRPYRRTLATMQYDLFNPPNVAGLPAYYQSPQYDLLWINADTLQKRIKLIDDFTVINYLWDEEYGHFLFDPIELAQQSSNPSSPSTLIDDWCSILFAVPISSAQKSDAKKVFLGSNQDAYWTGLWTDYQSNPSDKAITGLVTAKLRALLRHILALAEFQLM